MSHRLLRRLPLGLAAGVLATALMIAGGHGPALAAGADGQAAILARQAGFKKMGGAMKALNAQIKSGTPDKAAMAAAAATILDTARGQGALFPPNSGASAGIKTDALPAIWANKAKFDGSMTALVGEAGKLVATVHAGNDAAIAAQTKAVGDTCKSCHQQFRQDT